MHENEEFSPAHPIRVLLADDHDILRQGLKMLLSLQPDIEVVGEARTGREALELTRSAQPDVAILDISMADIDGLEACQQIRAARPETQVLILTMHESEEYFFRALRAGAIGYLVKKAAPADLHMAVHAVAAGGAYLYPGLARALVRAYTENAAPPATCEYASSAHTSEQAARLAEELAVLSPREIEVLQLVAEGRTNQEIADLLVISIKTVQAHRANVMEKLGLQHVTQLVRFAIRHGLLPVEPL
jgi:DNA-binding NarL/FixJ family response regulator